jgi:putative glutamine amidotransferase
MKPQQTRPLIGINADFFPATKLTGAHVRLNVGYFDSVVAAGGLPVILPPLGKEAEINAYLDQLDGIILSGGADPCPGRH